MVAPIARYWLVRYLDQHGNPSRRRFADKRDAVICARHLRRWTDYTNVRIEEVSS